MINKILVLSPYQILIIAQNIQSILPVQKLLQPLYLDKPTRYLQFFFSPMDLLWLSLVIDDRSLNYKQS